jgi:hypothetical protein
VPRDSRLAEALLYLPPALRHKAAQVFHLRGRAGKAFRQYDQLRHIFESRRNRLLQTEWRALAGVEFECFLAAVFEELGYSVTTTKASGDQGVDLILARDGVKVAVQAKSLSG